MTSRGAAIRLTAETSITCQPVHRNLVHSKTKPAKENVNAKTVVAPKDGARECITVHPLVASRVTGAASPTSNTVQRNLVLQKTLPADANAARSDVATEHTYRNFVPPKTRQTDTNIIGKTAFSRGDDASERLRRQLPATRVAGEASITSQRFISNSSLPRAMPNDLLECLLVKQGTHNRPKSYVAEESMCSSAIMTPLFRLLRGAEREEFEL